jgi:hypothetical protein
MSDNFDPDEPVSLDLGDEDPEDAMRRLLRGAGNDQLVSDEAAESLYELVEDEPEDVPEPLS